MSPFFFLTLDFFPPPELTFWRESAEVEQGRQQRQQDALRRRRRPCPVAPPRPQGGAVILTVAVVVVVVAVGGVRRCGIPPPSLFRRRIHPSCIIVMFFDGRRLWPSSFPTSSSSSSPSRPPREEPRKTLIHLSPLAPTTCPPPGSNNSWRQRLLRFPYFDSSPFVHLSGRDVTVDEGTSKFGTLCRGRTDMLSSFLHIAQFGPASARVASSTGKFKKASCSLSLLPLLPHLFLFLEALPLPLLSLPVRSLSWFSFCECDGRRRVKLLFRVR